MLIDVTLLKKERSLLLSNLLSILPFNRQFLELLFKVFDHDFVVV